MILKVDQQECLCKRKRMSSECEMKSDELKSVEMLSEGKGEYRK